MTKWTARLAPVLITFGPLLMVLSANVGGNFDIVVKYVGALGLGVGLTMMFRRQTAQERELNELRERIARVARVAASE